MIDSEDKRERRCPRLGHDIQFKYCRTQEGNSICPQVLNCWWELFDVEAFFRENLSEEEMSRLLNPPPPPPKVLSILELIEQAKKVKRDSE